MNNSNPFVPKGSILELQSKRRSRLKIAVFGFLTVAIIGLSVMLIQGCKREQPADTTDMSTPPVDSSLLTNNGSMPPELDTNPPAYVPPAVENPVAPVVPPVVPPVEPATSEYVVVKGDYLAGIARKHGVTLKALQAANPGIVPTKLKIGQKLVIPAPAPAAPTVPTMNSTGMSGEIYVVKSGDTLTKIAKAHGTTVRALQTENNLATTKIYVGEKLKIPSKAAAAAPAPVVEPAPVVPPPVLPETVPAR